GERARLPEHELLQPEPAARVDHRDRHLGVDRLQHDDPLHRAQVGAARRRRGRHPRRHPAVEDHRADQAAAGPAGRRDARLPQHDRRAPAVHRAADPRVLRAGRRVGQLHALVLHLPNRDRGRRDQPRRRDGGDPRGDHRRHLGALADRPPQERGIRLTVSTAPPPPAAPPAPPETRRQRRRRERLVARDSEIPVELYGLPRGTVTLLTVLAFLFALFTLIPIAWILINSTKTQANIFETFGFWFASPFQFFHTFGLLFQNVDGYGTLIQWFGNTALYAVLGGGGATVLAAFAGYGLARFRFRGSRMTFYAIIGALLVPITALTVPLYLTYAKAHLINSIWGMVLPSMISPIGVYLMRTYADISVPRELI